MGVRRIGNGLVAQVDAAEQRQAYNYFRKVRVLYGKVVMRTPVLSGALRAGWNVSYGAPDYTFTDRRGNKRKMTAIGSPSFPLTYDRQKAWHMFLANGAPYARKVEDGSSTQAPQGMLRISMLEVFGGTG